jgi:hypothetical protein
MDEVTILSHVSFWSKQVMLQTVLSLQHGFIKRDIIIWFPLLFGESF